MQVNRNKSSIRWSNIITSRANTDKKCTFYYNVVTKWLNVTTITVNLDTRYTLYYNNNIVF